MQPTAGPGWGGPAHPGAGGGPDIALLARALQQLGQPGLGVDVQREGARARPAPPHPGVQQQNAHPQALPALSSAAEAVSFYYQ